MDGRIFGLDIQLGFDVIMQGIAVFIMFALLSYILFEPVRKILEDRKNRIADEIDQAAADQAEAAKLKAEYDHKLKNVEKEADALMAQARKKALKREEGYIVIGQNVAFDIKFLEEMFLRTYKIKEYRQVISYRNLDIMQLAMINNIEGKISLEKQDLDSGKI